MADDRCLRSDLGRACRRIERGRSKSPQFSVRFLTSSTFGSQSTVDATMTCARRDGREEVRPAGQPQRKRRLAPGRQGETGRKMKSFCEDLGERHPVDLVDPAEAPCSRGSAECPPSGLSACGHGSGSLTDRSPCTLELVAAVALAGPCEGTAGRRHKRHRPVEIWAPRVAAKCRSAPCTWTRATRANSCAMARFGLTTVSGPHAAQGRLQVSPGPVRVPR